MSVSASTKVLRQGGFGFSGPAHFDIIIKCSSNGKSSQVKE